MCKNCTCIKVIPVAVWYSIANDGAGAAHPRWFLTEEDAEFHQEHLAEGWGEPCTGDVETYEGSYVHKRAVECSRQLKKDIENGETGFY